MTSRVNRLLAAAAGCAAGLLAVLGAAYFIGPLQRADAIALDGLRSVHENHHRVSVFCNGLVHSVDLPFLVAALALLFAAGLVAGRRRQAVAAVLLVVGANVLTQLLKVALAHPRYQPILAPHQLGQEAFPSGHTTAAMSLAIAAVLVAPSRWRPLAAVGAGGFGLSVSIALMLQGWHFPSDILGGFFVVGMVSMLTLAGLVVIEGETALHGRAERPPRRRPNLRSVGARALPAVLLAAAGGAALAIATHPAAVVTFVAANTTAVVAAIGISAASLGLVSGVAVELETS